MARIDRQSSSVSDLGVQDAVGPGELADVVQQPGGVDEVLFGLVAAELDRAERSRVAGDRRGVAAGRLVAQRERSHERR